MTTQTNFPSVRGTATAGTSTTVKAECRAEEEVTGGGYDLLPEEVTVVSSRPFVETDGRQGWGVTFRNAGTSDAPVEVWVVCASS